MWGHTHADTQRYTHAHTLIHTCTCGHICSNTHTPLTHMHTHKDTHSHAHMCTCRHTHMLTLIHMCTCGQTHTQRYTLTHTKIHTHMLTHTCTCRYTHMLTYTWRCRQTHVNTLLTLTCAHTRRHTQIHTHKLTNVHMQTHCSHPQTFTYADTRMLALTHACAPLPLSSSSIRLSFTSAPGAALSQAWRPHSCSPYLANAELFLKPLK